MNTRTRSSESLIRKVFIIDLILVIGSILLITIGGEIWLRDFDDNHGASLHKIYPQGLLCEPEPLLGPQLAGTWGKTELTHTLHLVVRLRILHPGARAKLLPGGPRGLRGEPDDNNRSAHTDPQVQKRPHHIVSLAACSGCRNRGRCRF